MTALQIALTITSVTPLSIGAGGSAGTIADKAIIRDGWGRPIIPGSQVKGKARFAVEQILRGLGANLPAPFDEPSRIEQQGLVRELFGSPQHPSPLRFADLPGVIGDGKADDLRLNSEQQLSLIRPSVALNRRRGTAEDARLLFQETALEGTRFHSDSAITGEVPELHHAALLWAGLLLCTRWGSAKSRGLGWSSVTVQVRFGEVPQDEGRLQQALRDLVETGRYR